MKRLRSRNTLCGIASLLCLIGLAALATRAEAGEVYVQSNLVSNISGMAAVTDPKLQDPWGVSFSTGSPFWVSDQASNVGGSSVTSLYSITPGTVSPITSFGILNQGGAPPSALNGPTGQVNTSAPGITTSPTDFVFNGAKAAFIFANMDGSISAWHGEPNATIVVPAAGASYTGLAIGNDKTGAAFIYAADQNSGNIDKFNSGFVKVGTLTDPNGLPAGFKAFNVQNIGGLLYATYTNQSNPLGGVVDVFKTDGTFVSRLINDPNGIWLDNPWGLAIAPKSFGQFGGDLLVGNNAGNGWINAFDPNNGNFLGVLSLSNGQPFSEADLWTLTFGNGKSGGDANKLYFTAGLASNVDGLLGSIAAVPEPSSAVLGLISISLMACGARWRARRARRPA